MLVHSPKTLALYVSDQRKKLKLNQTIAGGLVGLKQKTISSFENHPEGTRLETLFRILSAMNLDIHLIPKDEKIAGAKEWNQEW